MSVPGWRMTQGTRAMGERPPPWTRAKNRCLHRGGEGGMGVKEWVSGPPLGAGHCAQGSLAGKLLLVMKIGQ